MLDVNKIKKDFPLFINKPNICFLDSAASSIKLGRVIDKLNYYYNFLSVNVNRGPYKLSYEATNLYDESRIAISNYLNCSFEELIFTRGTTNSLNLASKMLEDSIKEGDEIITSELEHNSSILPWINIAKKKNAKIVYIPLINSRITLEGFKKVLTNKTKVIALTHVSNVLGYITPIEDIIKEIQNKDIITIIDGAQAAPHIKLDLKKINCDFYALSGHKMLGPTGIGLLYGKKELLKKYSPLEYGGDMALDVSKEVQKIKEPPYKFEAGTPIIAEAIALKEAFDYLNEIGLDNIHKHEQELTKYTMDKLSKIEGVTVYNKDCETGIVTFNIDGVHPHDAASIFDQEDVYIRAGNHCAHISAEYLNVISTIRASFYLYNDINDCDRLINTIVKARDFFNKF